MLSIMKRGTFVLLCVAAIVLGAAGWRYWDAHRDNTTEIARQTYRMLKSPEGTTNYEWHEAVKKMEAASRTDSDRRLVHRVIAFESFMTDHPRDTAGYFACEEELDNVFLEPPVFHQVGTEEMFSATKKDLSGEDLANYKSLLPLARSEPDPSPCLLDWNIDSR
jgi:hypothetical protein